MDLKQATVKSHVTMGGAVMHGAVGRAPGDPPAGPKHEPSAVAETIRVELAEAWGDMGAAWGVTPAIARVQAYLMARQEPLTERDASRMLVLDRRTQSWEDKTFRHFAEYLRPNDVVVVNNSRVIPARLIGRRKESGGRVEIFLVREIQPLVWEALVRPGARLHLGSQVIFGNGQLEAELLDKPGSELRRVGFKVEGLFEDAL